MPAADPEPDAAPDVEPNTGLDERWAAVVGAIDPRARLVQVTRLRGGLSSEMTVLDVDCGDGRRRFVARRSRTPGMAPLVIALDDPRADDVRALLGRHLAFAHAHSAAPGVHALDLAGLLHPDLSLFSARRGGELLAVGALKRLDDTHGELKSMHTAEASRGQGIGRTMVDHLVAVARARGYRRVSLETGAMEAFEPARSLYRRCGFSPCGPFGDYEPRPTSVFMTLPLAPG